MKLRITNKSGVWEITYEREPMPQERFEALVAVMITAIVAAALVAMVSLIGS